MSGNLSLKQRRRTSRRTGEKMSRLIAVALIITLSVAAHVVPTTRAKTSDPTLPPQTSAADYPLAGWQTATPQEVGMDPTLFAAAMAQMPSPSLVI